MNAEILLLQRNLILEQLMEVENALTLKGLKADKQGFAVYIPKGKVSFYVRYYDNGKQVANRSLDTADKGEAIEKAKKFRESILSDYYDKTNKIRDIIAFFSDYYKLEKSVYLQELLKKGERKVSPSVIQKYDSFINNYFIAFLKQNKITRMNQITITKLKDFQGYLVENGFNKKTGKSITAKTINIYINGAIKQIFTNLLMKGAIKETPFTKGKDFRFNLPETDKTRRGILPVYETLMALIDKEIWKLYKTKADIKTDKIANQSRYKKCRLICLLQATCGLRNAEIFMLRKENIIRLRRTYFIDVVNSRIGEKTKLKTESSRRKVPIPAITLQALNEYIEENNISNDEDYLFYNGSKGIDTHLFSFSKNHFGALCGYDEKTLKDKNIVFYSFRHFYKTILQRSKIKDDIIEYFMGHSVNVRNMAENYNNREDLDDIFFEESGLKVIEYINDLCGQVMAKYKLLPNHTHIEQIELTDNRGKAQIYFCEVLNKIDFEEETYFFICDLQDKGLLPNTNDKSELSNGLETLLQNGTIDKRRYDDCIDFVKNMKN